MARPDTGLHMPGTAQPRKARGLGKAAKRTATWPVRHSMNGTMQIWPNYFQKIRKIENSETNKQKSKK